MPHPEHIFGIEINDNSVRFAWAGHQFRVSEDLHVETARDGALTGSDISIILRKLFQLETTQP